MSFFKDVLQKTDLKNRLHLLLVETLMTIMTTAAFSHADKLAIAETFTKRFHALDSDGDGIADALDPIDNRTIVHNGILPGPTSLALPDTDPTLGELSLDEVAMIQARRSVERNGVAHPAPAESRPLTQAEIDA